MHFYAEAKMFYGVVNQDEDYTVWENVYTYLTEGADDHAHELVELQDKLGVDFGYSSHWDERFCFYIAARSSYRECEAGEVMRFGPSCMRGTSVNDRLFSNKTENVVTFMRRLALPEACPHWYVITGLST